MRVVTLTEKASDDSDHASNLEALEVETTLAAHRAMMEKQALAPKGWDRKTCYECEDQLAQQRIDNNRYRCVPCQTLVEKKQKGL